MDKAAMAVDNHKKGYNCAQAVACAFAEDLGVDEKDIFRMTEAFGFGMGSMGTCGAVSAMAVIIGLSESDGNLSEPHTKKKSYKEIKKLRQAFFEKNGSVICREIKGVDSGKVLRSCDGCVEDAARLIEDYLTQKIGQ